MSDINLWEAYDKYIASDFASGKLEEKLNALMLGISNRFFALKRNHPDGSHVIAFRAQQIRQVNGIVVLPGDLVLVDKSKQVFILITTTTSHEWSFAQFAAISLVEGDRVLWLPILSLKGLQKAKKNKDLPGDTIQGWILSNRLL